MAAPLKNRINILHMSDTHSCHRQIEQRFGPIPPDTDVLLHTGDMTNSGHDSELADFNLWIGELRQRMPHLHVICITGNHEFGACMSAIANGHNINPGELLNQQYFQARIPNAKVLSHCETICLNDWGVTIHGSSWVPWWRADLPGGKPAADSQNVGAHIYRALVPDQVGQENYFDRIPIGVDILMVHCPPRNLLDCLEGGMSSWGASDALLQRLFVSRPKCVLFGHVHEQRGFWQRVAVAPPPPAAAAAAANKNSDALVSKAAASGGSSSSSSSAAQSVFQGGTEYLHDGAPLPTHRPPSDLPVQVISNAALMNHGNMDRAPSQITGRPRRIVGSRADEQSEWSFVVDASSQPVYFKPVPRQQ